MAGVKSNLRLDDFAAAQAGGADAHAPVARGGFGADRTQVDVPAPLGHVMRVADFVAGTRLLAANFTHLCHYLTPNYEFWREYPISR